MSGHTLGMVTTDPGVTVRHGVLSVPPNPAVDTEAFAAWLTEEIFDRLRAQL